MKKDWGSYRILAEGKIGAHAFKIKALKIKPGWYTSTQRHRNRSEIFIFTSGLSVIGDVLDMKTTHKTITINPNRWHCVGNNSRRTIEVLEVQFGRHCHEHDIERTDSTY